MERGNGKAQSGLGEITDMVCEFLEVAIHVLLHIRGVYPEEIFERRRHLNVPVQWIRHPELREYINSAVASLRPWIEQGVVERVSVVFFDGNRSPLEKFIFKLRVNSSPSLSGAASRNSIEYALRAFFIKLSSTQQLLRPLPAGWWLSQAILYCSWEIVAFSPQLPGDRTSAGQFWIPAESGQWQSPPCITPIKSMTCEPLDMQLYVEYPKSEHRMLERHEDSLSKTDQDKERH